MRRPSKQTTTPGDAQQAREKCLRLLTTRARSRLELEQALRRNGFEEETVAEVLSGLEQAGLVDDEEFARLWVAERRSSGNGRRKLHWELRRKGIAESIIRDLLEREADDESELQQALRLARKRLAGEITRERLIRVQRLLVSRGFDYEIVETALQQVTSERTPS